MYHPRTMCSPARPRLPARAADLYAQVLRQVYPIRPERADADLVSSIQWPAKHPNAEEVRDAALHRAAWHRTDASRRVRVSKPSWRCARHASSHRHMRSCAPPMLGGGRVLNLLSHVGVGAPAVSPLCNAASARSPRPIALLWPCLHRYSSGSYRAPALSRWKATRALTSCSASCRCPSRSYGASMILGSGRRCKERVRYSVCGQTFAPRASAALRA